MTEYNPGPLDESILYEQKDHISTAIWNGKVYLTLKKVVKYFNLCSLGFYLVKYFSCNFFVILVPDRSWAHIVVYRQIQKENFGN